MSKNLDETLRLMAMETMGHSLADDGAFKRRLMGLDAPTIDDTLTPPVLLTALVAAAIGLCSHVLIDRTAPLPPLISYEHVGGRTL